MAQFTIYEYTTTRDGTHYNAAGTPTSGTINDTTLSVNGTNTFTFDGQTFTYLGGADEKLKGETTQVGFFAKSSDGSVHFFSTSGGPAPAGNLTLNAGETETLCLMAGSLVATPTGPTPIESLSEGDLVLTHDGRSVPVLWIGRQSVSTLFADALRVLPIRIKADALDEALPARDLLVSPCPAILLDGILVQAGALVNGTSIIRDADVPQTFVYYHLETEDHSMILAEGVPVETFIDNAGRQAFDNWSEHLALFPEGRAMVEIDLPRVTSARQLPASIAQRLAARSPASEAPSLAA